MGSQSEDRVAIRPRSPATNDTGAPQIVEGQPGVEHGRRVVGIAARIRRTLVARDRGMLRLRWYFGNAEIAAVSPRRNAPKARVGTTFSGCFLSDQADAAATRPAPGHWRSANGRDLARRPCANGQPNIPLLGSSHP